MPEHDGLYRQTRLLLAQEADFHLTRAATALSEANVDFLLKDVQDVRASLAFELIDLRQAAGETIIHLKDHSGE